MKKYILVLLATLFMSGCTQIITAPIKAVGAVGGAVIDVGAAGVHAVTGSDDKEK